MATATHAAELLNFCKMAPIITALINRFKKSDYLKAIAALLLGAGGAQLLGLLFMPILTRCYTKDEFGLFASYQAVVHIIFTVATLKYDSAVVLPKEADVAEALYRLARTLIFLLTIPLSLLLFLPLAYFEEYRGIEWYILVGSIGLSCYTLAHYWYIRTAEFKKLSAVKFLQVLLVFLFQLLCYYIYRSKGLILGSILGVGISYLILEKYRIINPEAQKSADWNLQKKAALRYIDFPRYFCLSDLFASFSGRLPVLLLISYASLAQIGIYDLANRVILVPISLIGLSLGSAALSRMAQKRNLEEPLFSWYLKNFLGLLGIGVIIAGAIIAFGKTACVWVFGPKWEEAGDLLIAMIPLFIAMIPSCLGNAAVRVFEKQKFMLIYTLITTLLKAGALLLMMHLHWEFTNIILWYSILAGSVFLINGLYFLRLFHQYDQNLIVNNN